MKDIEKRMLISQPCELRAAQNESEQTTIAGYGAVFNARSLLLFDLFVEEIAPGAFDDVLNDDVRALFNHDRNFVLGRTTSGTLQLEADTRGLSYIITPPDTQTVRDLVLTPIARGDVTGSSFGFRVADDGDEWRQEGDLVIRTIHRFSRLIDISPVTYPAYEGTHVAQRSLDAWKEECRYLMNKSANERHARERFLDLINL